VNASLTVPIAHGEGNYFIDHDGLKKLQDQDQILFRYCDENGKVNPWSNPNGSIDNIAGVANEGMNVFGMMPHPERAASSDLGNTDGAAILSGLTALVEA
jgi:phosphoribosylformylglycinamidine synthase